MSSGLLNHIEQTYPDAKVTIACGPLAVSLFEGYPLLEEILPLKKEPHNKHWIKLWKRVVGARWDIVIDLRDSAVSRLVLAKQRFIFSKHIDKTQHKVKQNADVMQLGDQVPAPKLWFSNTQKEKAAALIPDGTPVLAIGPTANWIGKTWPAERFVEAAEYILSEYMQGARVAVFGAPGEEEGAYAVFNAMPEGRRIDAIAKGSPGDAAACLARCDFYLGNDSGLMHCAAAAGVPTVGVFGPSYPHIYAPYGSHTTYARTWKSFDELIDFEGYDPRTLKHSLMEGLPVCDVQAVIDELIKKQRAA